MWHRALLVVLVQHILHLLLLVLVPSACAFDTREHEVSNFDRFQFVVQLAHVSSPPQQADELARLLDDRSLTQAEYESEMRTLPGRSVLEPHCSATLLSHAVALTAAHCVQQHTHPARALYDTDRLRVVVGGPWGRRQLADVGVQKNASQGVIGVKRIEVHPRWQGCSGACRTSSNDLALLILESCTDAVLGVGFEFPQLNTLRTIDEPTDEAVKLGNDGRFSLAWRCHGTGYALARGNVRLLNDHVAKTLFSGTCGTDAFGGPVDVSDGTVNCVVHDARRAGGEDALAPIDACSRTEGIGGVTGVEGSGGGVLRGAGGGGALLVETTEAGYTLLGVSVSSSFAHALTIPSVRVSRYASWLKHALTANAAVRKAACSAKQLDAVAWDTDTTDANNMANGGNAVPKPCCCAVSPTRNCYVGKGGGYRGHARLTEGDKVCAPWASHAQFMPSRHPLSGLHGAYCRNPQGPSAQPPGRSSLLGPMDEPWCFVEATKAEASKRRARWARCLVQKCTLAAQSTDPDKTCAPFVAPAEHQPTPAPTTTDGRPVPPKPKFSHEIALSATILGYNSTTFTGETQLRFGVAVASSLGVGLDQVETVNVTDTSAGSAEAGPSALLVNFLVHTNHPSSLDYWMRKGVFVEGLVEELQVHGISVSKGRFDLSAPLVTNKARRRSLDVLEYSLISTGSFLFVTAAAYGYYRYRKKQQAREGYSDVAGAEDESDPAILRALGFHTPAKEVESADSPENEHLDAQRAEI